MLRANPDYEQRYRFGSVMIRGHRCIRQVGSGGMCKIYLAESERAGTLVVLEGVQPGAGRIRAHRQLRPIPAGI